MNQPATDAQLKQARRNQEFTNTPLGKGQCPLMQGEVAIFPVRYALDESPKKGSNLGPNPLPKNWSGKLPELKTRSYTLRQLRDGWLYVWNSVDKTFHEYQVKGELLIRHKWTDSQLNKDERNNPGESQPYLLYPRRSQLRIAYSSVQWTWRMCELMRSSATEQTQWMRKVDLPAFCTSGKVAHGAPITELGSSVADILAAGEAAPAFTSTLLPTKAGEAGVPFKAAFDEALVRGRVPEQDTALFVALDDPLAMIDDLSMNLAGRLVERGNFVSKHKNEMESAETVLNLCGLDTDPLIPKSIKEDPIQKQAYINDLYTLLQANEQIERGKDLVPAYQAGMVEIGGAKIRSEAEAPFKAKWGSLPERTIWQKALDEWNSKRYWREDVRFDEAQKYIGQKNTELHQLQSHCERSELDLLTWLGKLSPSAEAVYHDTCNEAQSSELLETAHAVYSLLSNDEKGQQWLCKQAEKPDTLFGTALYNFSPELATLIKKVTHNFSTTGSLDDQGSQGDGSSPALNPTSSSDSTNIATRVGELKGVLDLQSVQNSKLYKAMSAAAQQTMTTLISVANNKAKDAWHGLSVMLLPAMKQDAALVLAAPQVLISTEISSATQLTLHPTYQRDYQAWLQRVLALNNKITGARNVLQRPSPAHDQRSARISLQTLEAQMNDLFVQRPNQIVAKASGSTRLQVALPKVNGWLSDLGQAEVVTQMKSAGRPEYATRAKAWMAQNMGNALPALLVGLNVWNTYNIAKQAQNDGKFTEDEWRNLGSSAAYAGNALAALWVGPAWSRAGEMVGQLGTKTRAVAQAGYKQWLKQAKASPSGGTQAAVANEFATVSKGLILRTVTWAALGVVATALEAWQLSKDIEGATSAEERGLLSTKRYIVLGMMAVSSLQAVGAGLGYWFGFAWVMSTPVTIILAILGIAYLMITAVANRYKREGLRLWLYRCSWGRGSKPEWLHNAGHPKQMKALLETLQRPSVLGRASYHGGGSTPRQWHGFWVQVQVPNTLAGKEIALRPAMIETHYFSKDELQATTGGFYEQFRNGNWVDPKLLGQLPNGRGGINNPADFSYTKVHQHRLWQVWIDTSTASPVLEMEVEYPTEVLRREDGRGYVFRLAMEWSTSEADRSNTAFSGELKEQDDIVLASKSTQRLTLAVPQARKK